MTSATEDVLFEIEGGIAVRRYRDGDTKSISYHGNNANVKKNLRDRFPHPYTEEDSRAWISITRDDANHVKSGRWTPEGGSEGPLLTTDYTITVNDEAVGGIGLVFGKDVYFRNAEIGYWLGEELWGKKVMSRVVKEFVDWAWRTFGVLARLTGEVFEWNSASRTILERAGFVYEGRQKNMVWKSGKLCDQLLFGATRALSQE